MNSNQIIQNLQPDRSRKGTCPVVSAFFPNPTNDFITVEDKTESINEIKIFNIIGELVKLYNVSNNQTYTINLNGLSQGIYNLVTYTKKIIK